MRAVSVDSVLHLLSQPLVWGSTLLYVLYTTPIWVARLLTISTIIFTATTYLNNNYKRRGSWQPLNGQDIALVTGGSNGLGLETVRLLIQRDVQCIVIDKEEITDTEVFKNVTFINCDLSDEYQIMKTVTTIKRDIGTPTILINNAAMRHSQSLAELTYSQIHTLLTVNTLAPTILMKEFLKSPSRLYTVNVSSVLGLVSPTNLSLYSATKAALISLHDSISHEHKSNDKRFLLVTPGQLDTRMFKDVKPPKAFLAPVIHAQTLAEEIVRCIDRGERGTLHGPMYTYFIPLLKLLPYSWGEFARWFSEMDESVARGSKSD